MSKKTDAPAEGQDIAAEAAALDRLLRAVEAQGPQYAHIPEFAAAEPYLQDAIAALIAEAPRNDDGTLTVYPALAAWIDGESRTVHPVTEDRAVFLLCHVPPPFYLSADAAFAGHVLADRPTP